MSKVYKNTVKRILADGTQKVYTYQQIRYRPVSAKTVLFNELKDNEQFKNIITDKNLNNVQMFDKIYDFTRNNDKFKVFTQKQIKNLIYRCRQ